MSLDPTDIATVSRLLDVVLDLPPAERERWLDALPMDEQRHAATLREMLARQSRLDQEQRLNAMPRIGIDEAVAQAGDVVGPYRLLREIGRGGMGSVWLAERADGSFKRHVALKLPRLAWGAGLAERMAREREIGAMLEHPNIARLYDAGVDAKGRPYLALEHIDGQPIDAWCEARALGVRERLHLFIQVAKAVSYAHGRLVVHRDLKPSNVMVTPDGQAHLLDFGIAKLLHEEGVDAGSLTQEQGRVLSPHYASPEQVSGDAITVQSDVYSLGVLLYELLTGTLPIAPARVTPAAVEHAILLGDAPPASSRARDQVVARALRGEVDAILDKAMKRRPAERYATADAMAQDIEHHLNGETVMARPDGATVRLRKTLRRHRVAFSAAAAVLAAMVTGSGVAMVQAQRANNEAERARLVKDFVVRIFDTSGSADGTLMQLPAHQLLERSARMIDAQFAGQPRLQAELYGAVRQMFSNLANYTAAADYGLRQFEALRAAGAPRAALAQVEIDLASDLSNLGRTANAVEHYRHALAIAGDDPALQVQAHAGLSLQVLAYVGADAKAQKAEIEAAVEVMSRRTVPPMVRAGALVALASWTESEQGIAKATPLFDEAIQIALDTQGPTSRTAMNARTTLGSIHARQGDKEAALRYYAPALATMRMLGGPYDVRAAQEEARLASALYDKGWGPQSFADTRATFERSLAALTAQSGPVPKTIVNEVNALYGSVLSNWGDVARGYALMASNAKEFLAASPHSNMADVIRRELADTASRAGHFKEAVAAAEVELEWSRLVVTAPADLFPVYWLLAGTYMDAGHFKEAEGVLADYAALPGGAEALRTRWGPQAWGGLPFPLFALLRLESGDSKAALELTQALDPTRHVGKRLGNVWLIRAEALCSTGHAEEGLALFQSWLPKLFVDVYDASPGLASTRARMGLCALRVGRPQVAREASLLASAALAKQPDMGERYKAPILELERRLSGK